MLRDLLLSQLQEQREKNGRVSANRQSTDLDADELGSFYIIKTEATEDIFVKWSLGKQTKLC